MAPRLPIEIVIFFTAKSVCTTYNAKRWSERALNHMYFIFDRFSIPFLRLQEPKEFIFS